MPASSSSANRHKGVRERDSIAVICARRNAMREEDKDKKERGKEKKEKQEQENKEKGENCLSCRL